MEPVVEEPTALAHQLVNELGAIAGRAATLEVHWPAIGDDDRVLHLRVIRERALRLASTARTWIVGEPGAPERLSWPDLEIDLAAREVWRSGMRLELTPKEFDLLAHLARQPWRAHSYAELIREVWGCSPDHQGRGTVSEHVRRLRRKIERHPERPVLVQTVRRYGYRFVPELVTVAS